MEKLDYIPDPRYSENGMPVKEGRPNNSSAVTRQRSTVGARSSGGMLKRSMRAG
jgi:hypothetical protein